MELSKRRVSAYTSAPKDKKATNTQKGTLLWVQLSETSRVTCAHIYIYMYMYMYMYVYMFIYVSRTESLQSTSYIRF